MSTPPEDPGPPAAGGAQHRRDTTADVADVGRHLVNAERQGSRPAKSWASCVGEGERFKRWLGAKGLSVDELIAAAELDAFGKPVLRAPLLLAYLADTLTDSLRPDSLERRLDWLLSWFRGTGWAMDHFATGCTDAAVVRAFVANHRRDDAEARVRRPARPVTNDWLDAITAVIDASIEAAAAGDDRDDGDDGGDLDDGDDLDPSRAVSGCLLWLEAVRAFHVFVCVAAFRAGEAACRARWGWFDDHGSWAQLATPGGNVLKNQAQPVALPLPSPDSSPARIGDEDCENPGVCALHALRRWRRVCEAAGVPTGPDDLLFPAVRRHPGRTHLWWRDRLWVADPLAEQMERLDSAASDDAVAVALQRAHQTHWDRYTSGWRQAAVAAGFQPRHRFERVSSHGARRGRATQMRINGTPLASISVFLRHNGLATAPLYIDGSLVEPPDPRPLFTLDLPRHGAVAVCEIGDLLDDAPPLVHRGVCELVHDGIECGRCFAAHIALDDPAVHGMTTVVPVCHGHYLRHWRGCRDEDLATPIGRQPLAPACEIAHHGVVCGRPPLAAVELDRVRTTACSTHYWRAWRGLTGDDLTGPPLRHRRAAGCELVHAGVGCGRTAVATIEVDGSRLTACSAHYQRYRNGQRGRALTRPVGARPSRSCEVLHDGVPCGRASKNPIWIDVGDGQDTTACKAHYERFRTGARGEHLTRPVNGRTQ